MKRIYKHKDGRFEGRCSSGMRNGGKVGYKPLCGRAEASSDKRMRDYRRGTAAKVAGAELTVKKLFSEWLTVTGMRVKEATLSNYRNRAEKHILPYFGDMRADAVTAETVQRFIRQKLDSGLSHNYVSDIVMLLKAVFKYGSRSHGFYNSLSEVIMPKKKKPSTELLNPQQQNRLKKYLLENPCTSSLGILLCLYTGIRLGELCALQWGDIDLVQQTLSVEKTVQRISDKEIKGTRLIITEPKSASSNRLIPLPDCLMPMLKNYRADNGFYLLSGTEKPVEPRTMQYRFQAILKKENLPSIHFHALRHMFATNCIALGFDVKSLSELLGHSGVEITLNRYVHSSMERKRSFMKELSFSSIGNG